MVPPARDSEYETQAERLAGFYESYSPEQLNAWLAPYLPAAPAAILDVGAGSGRDAAWLAARGLRTVAVEPAAALRTQTAQAPGPKNIEQRAGQLPGLPCAGESYAFILLNAVWMFVAERDRPAACSELAGLLEPGGVLAATLREPIVAARGMEPADAGSFAALAATCGLKQICSEAMPDPLRPDVSWLCLAVRKAGSKGKLRNG